MDVEPYLNPRHKSLVQVDLDPRRRDDLRQLFGEELVGEPFATRRKPYVREMYFSYEEPAVSAGDLLNDKRDWIVADTVFGRRYLALADRKGGFILLALLPDVPDVLVEFDRPAAEPKDRPNRHDDNFVSDPRRSRNRLQYLTFLFIANDLVFEAEQQS